MTPEMETPPADGTANGAKIKAGEARMADYQNTNDTATLSRLRSAHLARLCGITDHRAAMLAALAFAGCAP